MAAEAELHEQYQRWVDAVVAAGEVWIIGEGDQNTVIEDPDADRDLNLLFSSRADAEQHPERGEVLTPPISVDDFAEILDGVDERGEGLALWHGDGWIVAEAAPPADEIRERATER